MCDSPSYSKYSNNVCRCPDCTTEARLYRRMSRKRQRHPFYIPRELVGAKEAVAHLRWLRSNGMTYAQISRLAEMPESMVRRITHGQQKRVSTDVEDRILALGLHRSNEARVLRRRRGWLPADAVAAHVKRLHGQGVSYREMSRRSRVALTRVLAIAHSKQRSVTPAVADRLLALSPQRNEIAA